MIRNVKTLAQLKVDAVNGDWGKWCAHWGMNPLRDMHVNDERALFEGCYFDVEAAERVRRFFCQLLRVPNNLNPEELGEHEQPTGTRERTKPFHLLNWWYRDVIGPLFGWKKRDGRRRFSKSFVTTAKKSGKSSVMAGLPLYMLLADGEEEAECYSAAVDRDQASIIFRKADRMKGLSPSLSKKLKTIASKNRIIFDKTGSSYEAISSDADSADGTNPHLLIVDELHRWKSRDFFETLLMGDIQRQQPLFIMITTAGNDLTGICYEEYDLAKQLDDPDNPAYEMSHHVVIKEAAPHREWDDPVGWLEASPSILEGLGSLESLQKKCNEARLAPRKRRYFTRTICNRWVDADESCFLNQDGWKECGSHGDVARFPFLAETRRRKSRQVDLLPEHHQAPCAGGMDLSSRIDITALSLAFEYSGYIDLMWWFWIPEESILRATERDKVPYQDWVDEGWIEATPGNSVDYAYIRRQISGVVLDEEGKPSKEKWEHCLNNRFKIQEIGYDPWGANKLVPELDQYDGVPMVEFRQGFASMSRPCKDFEAMVLDGRIRHGNNPVASWMSRNAVVVSDPAENIKLSKKKARHRFDGIVAAVMATELCLNGEGAEQRPWSGAGTGMWD